MNPNVCFSPTFKNPVPKRRNMTREISSEVASRLQEVALRLREDMEKQKVEAPQSVIEISGEVGQCIIIKEVEHSGKAYLVIQRGSDIKSPLYKVEKKGFRHVQFSFLTDCRVFVLAKLVRVFFMRCQQCSFSIRSPLIGKLEFFKCFNSKVNIRIPQKGPEPPIPLVMVESCSEFHIYQSVDELFYVVTRCDRITGNIVDPKTNQRKERYSLGKIIWDAQERILVLLSREKGFASVPDRYSLHDIAHHIMIRPAEDSEESSQIEDLFGTTPPTASFWNNFS